MTINESEILWGSFVSAAMVFLLTALAVFLFVVRPYNTYTNRLGRMDEEEQEASGPSEIDLLIEIRDSLRYRPG